MAVVVMEVVVVTVEEKHLIQMTAVTSVVSVVTMPMTAATRGGNAQGIWLTLITCIIF
jgi:hypothetical protein